MWVKPKRSDGWRSLRLNRSAGGRMVGRCMRCGKKTIFRSYQDPKRSFCRPCRVLATEFEASIDWIPAMGGK
jgi:hypothetical protein